MQIRLKLMASLRAKLPSDGSGGQVLLQVEEGSTAAQVLANVGVSDRQVHLVMRNGEQLTDLAQPLADGDELVVFPPVAGGA